MPHRSLLILSCSLALAALSCSSAPTPARAARRVAVVRPIAIADTRQTAPPPEPAIALDLSSGCAQTCTLRANRSVWCWGAASEPSPLSPRRIDAIRDARSLACGAWHCCALLVDGAVSCWRIPAQSEAAEVTPIALREVVEIASGGDNTCALTRTGAVSCWQMRAESFTQPRAVQPVEGARRLAVGPTHSCALRDDRTVRCWGHNADGQLGPGAPRNARRVFDAVAVTGVTEAVEVAVGDRHSCARTAAGEVWCWGSNASGQSGIGPYAGTPEPLRVQGVMGALSLSAGPSHTCVVLSDRSVECWGNNRTNAVGEIRPSVASSPVPVPTVDRATRVAPSCDATCAVREDGSVRCWGARYSSPASPRGRPIEIALP